MVRPGPRLLRSQDSPSALCGGCVRVWVALNDPFRAEMEAMASFFKKKLMCTTSVAAMPGKNNKYEELLIQGHHIDAVLEQARAGPLQP
jgi:translation initiation factor 1 (eIF-1/SUI1)